MITDVLEAEMKIFGVLNNEQAISINRMALMRHATVRKRLKALSLRKQNGLSQLLCVANDNMLFSSCALVTQ